jgi:hypothetical protein
MLLPRGAFASTVALRAGYAGALTLPSLPLRRSRSVGASQPTHPSPPIALMRSAEAFPVALARSSFAEGGGLGCRGA